MQESPEIERVLDLRLALMIYDLFQPEERGQLALLYMCSDKIIAMYTH